MHFKLAQYAFFAWCILLSGCTLCQNARRTTCQEPRAFSWKGDRRRSVEAYRQLADQVLQQEAIGCPDLVRWPDYAMGFRDGFVDYMYAGGSGEPPPVPPRQFWNVALRAPDGKERVQQWFDGYRHGAGVARDGGYRDLGIVHSSVLGLEEPPYGGYGADTTASFGSQDDWSNAASDAQTESLPVPGEAPALAPPVETNKASGDVEADDSATDTESALPPIEVPSDSAATDTAESSDGADEATQDSTPAATNDSNDEPFGDDEPGESDGNESRENARPSTEPPASEPVERDAEAADAENDVSRDDEKPTLTATIAKEFNARRSNPTQISPGTSPSGRSSLSTGENSTLHFITPAPSQSVHLEKSRAAPSALVQTSFVVKAPAAEAPPIRLRIDTPGKQSAHGNAPLSPATTIKIRTATESQSHPSSFSNNRKPTFIR